MAVKILTYQRDLIFAGLASISDPHTNRRGFDANLISTTFKTLERDERLIFADVKQDLLKQYHAIQALTRTSELNTEIFHPSL